MEHSCKICGTIFIANIRALYCSDNCKSRAYYDRHKSEPEFKERCKNHERAARARHGDEINRRRRERFITDVEYRLRIKSQTAKSRQRKPQNQNYKTWISKNPYKALLKNLRTRGKRLVSEKDLELVFSRDNFQCVYCHSITNLSVDHKLPVTRGGDSTIDNLCLACKSCNSRKGAKTVEEFLQYLKEATLWL